MRGFLGLVLFVAMFVLTWTLHRFRVWHVKRKPLPVRRVRSASVSSARAGYTGYLTALLLAVLASTSWTSTHGQAVYIPSVPSDIKYLQSQIYPTQQRKSIANRAASYYTGSYITTATSGTGTSTGSNSSTTLNDTGKAWTVNAFTNYVVRITSGTGAEQVRVISSNTATALTVPAWTTTPDATSVYSIGNVWNGWTVRTVHDCQVQSTNIQVAFGNYVTYHGDTVNSSTPDSGKVGTATSATVTTLVDSAASFTGMTNHYVKIIAGTDVGDVRNISSVSGTAITVAGWNTTPDNTSQYAIYNVWGSSSNFPLGNLTIKAVLERGFVSFRGTATGGTTTSLIDTTLTQFSGLTDYFVYIRRGKGAGQPPARIASISNGNATVNIASGTWTVAPDNTSVYEIIDYTKTGQAYPLTFNGGQSSITLPPWGIAYCDPVAITLDQGERFHIRNYQKSDNGWFPLNLTLRGADLTCECHAQNVDYTNQPYGMLVMSGKTQTSAGTNGWTHPGSNTPPVYGPLQITGTVLGNTGKQQINVAFVGDSLSQGINDGAFDSSTSFTDRGSFVYALNLAQIPYTHLGMKGEQASDILTEVTSGAIQNYGYRARGSLLSGCTHALVWYGDNDLATDTSATMLATLQTNINRIISYLKGLGIQKIWLTTIPPRALDDATTDMMTGKYTKGLGYKVGTVSAVNAGTFTITDSASNVAWTSIAAHRQICFITGTAAGTSNTVASFTTNTLTMDAAFSVTPAVGDTYVFAQPASANYGPTATGAGTYGSAGSQAATNRAIFNAWIRSVGTATATNGFPAPLVTGYIEGADPMESARNSGIWKPYSTKDGVHPVSADNTLAANGYITLANWITANIVPLLKPY